MKINDYKQAMDIISDGNTDWRAIVVKIAKYRPDVLVYVAGDRERGLLAEAKLLAETEGKVSAVKFVRAQKACSLADAARVVKTLMEAPNPR